MKGLSEGLKLVIVIVAVIIVVKLLGGVSKVAQSVTGAVKNASQGVQFSKVFSPIKSNGTQALGLNSGAPTFATADLVYNGGGFSSTPGLQSLQDLNSLAVTDVLVNPPA